MGYSRDPELAAQIAADIARAVSRSPKHWQNDRRPAREARNPLFCRHLSAASCRRRRISITSHNVYYDKYDSDRGGGETLGYNFTTSPTNTTPPVTAPARQRYSVSLTSSSVFVMLLMFITALPPSVLARC